LPSMMSSPTALPFRPSTGISASAWTKISKRSGVMRRKKPPNRRTESPALGSDEPPSLILSEPTISMAKDCAGSTKVWPSASSSNTPTAAVDLMKKTGPTFFGSVGFLVMIFHCWPRMMVCTLAVARSTACCPAVAVSASTPAKALVSAFFDALVIAEKSTSPSTLVDRPASDRLKFLAITSPGMPSSEIFSVFAVGVVLICSIALPSAKMP